MDRDAADRQLLQTVADLDAAGGIVESTAVTANTPFDHVSVLRELRRLMEVGLLDGVIEEAEGSPMPPKITNLHLTASGRERLGS